MLLHSSWTISTFSLCLVSYAWSLRFDLNLTLCALLAPTLIFSASYLALIPTKKLRIKYGDESLLGVVARTWSLILNDVAHILPIKNVKLLLFVNILGATNSIMFLFIFGIWLQTFFDFDIFGVGLYTLVQGVSELMLMVLMLAVDTKKRSTYSMISILAATTSILSVAALFGSTYLTMNRLCAHSEWLCIKNRGNTNHSLLALSMFGIMFGHEAFVSTVNSAVFRECRKNNTPNAAYPLWNGIGSTASFIGQITVGLIWHYGDQHAMLFILALMLALDVIALFLFIYTLFFQKTLP